MPTAAALASPLVIEGISSLPGSTDNLFKRLGHAHIISPHHRADIQPGRRAGAMSLRHE